MAGAQEKGDEKTEDLGSSDLRILISAETLKANQENE